MIDKKYLHIYNDLKSKIIEKQFEIGDIIPSENILCKEYNVSRITIRSALLELQKNGYIKKHQGKGSIVISNNEKRKIILLIVTNIFTYIFSDIIKNIESTCRENNISLFIACSYNDRKIEQDIIKYHLHDIDGIIFEPTQTSLGIEDENIKNFYYQLNNLPCVLINTKLPFMDLPSLTTDDFTSSKILTEKLVKQGKKSFLTVFKIDERQGVDRLAGVENILKDQNDFVYNTISFDSFSENSIIDKVYSETQKKSYDVIMFYNDNFAYSFIQKYPEFTPHKSNTIITGFDSHEVSNGHPYYFPSPVHPKGKMGVDAANMIINLINGKEIHSIVYDIVITNID